MMDSPRATMLAIEQMAEMRIQTRQFRHYPGAQRDAMWIWENCHNLERELELEPGRLVSDSEMKCIKHMQEMLEIMADVYFNGNHLD